MDCIGYIFSKLIGSCTPCMLHFMNKDFLTKVESETTLQRKMYKANMGLVQQTEQCLPFKLR